MFVPGRDTDGGLKGRGYASEWPDFGSTACSEGGIGKWTLATASANRLAIGAPSDCNGILCIVEGEMSAATFLPHCGISSLGSTEPGADHCEDGSEDSLLGDVDVCLTEVKGNSGI